VIWTTRVFSGCSRKPQLSFQNLVDLLQGRLGFFAGPAHDHKIVAVMNCATPASEHLVVEGVEECIAQ